MNLSSLFKQLKKRLRQKRRWLSLGFFIVAAVVGFLAAVAASNFADSKPTGADVTETASMAVAGKPLEPLTDEQRDMLGRIRRQGGTMDVYVHRTYVCGEENRLLGNMNADEITSLQAENPGWSVRLGDTGIVTFTEPVDDLSPACKDYAFFGLDKDGNLSLFEGPPEDEKVIRTFFQLNLGYLESSLPHGTVDQLREGIRVVDMAEYNSVLSTFSDFAVEETEKVMKTTD